MLTRKVVAEKIWEDIWGQRQPPPILQRHAIMAFFFALNSCTSGILLLNKAG